MVYGIEEIQYRFMVLDGLFNLYLHLEYEEGRVKWTS